MQAAVVVAHDDLFAGHALDHAVSRRQGNLARVARGALLHARADQRRRRLEQRHGLALHVRAHQRAVGVVVLEERDQRARHGHGLLGRDIHVVDLLGAHGQKALAVAGRDELVGQRAVLVHVHVGLGDDVAVLFVGRQVADLVGHVRPDVDPLRGQLADLVGDLVVDDACRWPTTTLPSSDLSSPRTVWPTSWLGRVLDLAQHAAVRRLDEAVLVDAAVGGQRADQTDVRAFRRLDRADAAVVRVVHVAHFEARAVAAQTARAKRRSGGACGSARPAGWSDP